MNRAELISEVADLTGHTKTQVGTTLQATIHAITAALAKGEKVTLVGFGTFDRRNRSARTGRNPQTMAILRIPAARVPAFRPGLELKEIVDGRKRLGAYGAQAAKKPAAKKPAAKKTVKRR